MGLATEAIRYGYDLSTLKVIDEVADVARFCSSESVDALVIVPHYEQT
jgi:hypothetical protein